MPRTKLSQAKTGGNGVKVTRVTSGAPALLSGGVKGEMRDHSHVNVQRVMDAGNLYLQSLLHPASVYGAKVPDGSFEESSTITEYTRVAFDGGTNASPVASVILGVPQTDGGGALVNRFSLVPTKDDVAALGGAEPWKLGLVSDPVNATPSNIFGLGTTPTLVEHPGADVFYANFRLIRLVSAGMRITCAGAALTTKGWVTLAVLPRGLSQNGFLSTVAGNKTIAGLQTMPGQVTVPLTELGQGLSAHWIPLDNSCFEYVVEHCDQHAEDPDHVNWSRHDIGGFWVAAYGTDSAAPPPFMLELVTNYEAVPLSNAVMMTATKGVDDPLALSHAMNVAQEVDTVAHSSGGFEGGHEGTALEHVAEQHTKAVPAKVAAKGTPGALGTTATFSKVALIPHVQLNKVGQKNKTLARRVAHVKDDDDEPDTFTRIMQMLIPVAEKVLPSVLEAFL